MSLISKLLNRLKGQRSAEERWNERWADPSFHPEPVLEDIAHHFIMAGYARVLKPGGVLLDAGCGDGEFRPHLHPDAFSKYVGIDFAEPVARAQRYADDRTSFEASDIRSFTPSIKFDTIMFNEALYYIDDAIGELERYAAFLAPDGIFLVSLHLKPKTEALWGRIGKRFHLLDRVTVENAKGVRWGVGAFRPRG
jgi:SAM-dependent methyltransferase